MGNVNKALLASALGMGMIWCTGASAACLQPQVTGIWEAAFSDGNSCRLRVMPNGNVSAADSVCYDPDRGSTTPESGRLKVKADCSSEGELT